MHRLQLLWLSGSVVVAHGLSSCGSWALERRLSSCGARALLLCGMWDLPRPGLEPSPAPRILHSHRDSCSRERGGEYREWGERVEAERAEAERAEEEMEVEKEEGERVEAEMEVEKEEGERGEGERELERHKQALVDRKSVV